MGLDISAVSELRKIELPKGMKQYSDEYYEWEREEDISVWTIPENQHFDEQLSGLDPGPYVSDGDVFSFRAGSYSWYNTWRDILARTFGYESGAQEVWNEASYGDKGYELINFSDADGVIGPIASEKLYNDFVKYEKEVMKNLDSFYFKMVDFEINGETYDWFKVKYNDWKEAFRIASDNGAVFFY